ncbi:MAG: hypothetical protein U1F29_16775 [Planctomycetota bacterium]
MTSDGSRAREGSAGPELRLHVRELDAAVRFAVDVLGAEVEPTTPGNVRVRRGAASWTLVADAAASSTVMRELASLVVRRGAGIELLVTGADPSELEARARSTGHGILTPAGPAPDGCVEARVVDRDGYVWLARRERA